MNAVADFWRAEAHYNATRSLEDALRVADAAISSIDQLQEELETAQWLQREAEKDSERYWDVLKDVYAEVLQAEYSDSEKVQEYVRRIRFLLEKIF
jgi:uncharacterized protein YpuA (DUF1002 family)